MSGYIIRDGSQVPADIAYAARDAAAQVRSHVLAQQINAIDRAQAIRDQAASFLNSLANQAPRMVLGSVSLGGAPDNPPPPGVNFNIDYSPPNVGAVTSPGSATTHMPGDISAVTPPQIDDFTGSFSDLTITDPPTPGQFDFPLAPDINFPDMPDRPRLALPSAPTLVELNLPAMTFTPLAPFDDEDPQFQASSVSPVLQWAERPYQPVLMDEEIEVVRRMWAGGTGLPEAVEQALWERAASREDLAISRDVSAAAVEFSSRGYTLPPGALVARIDTIRSEGALRKQGLARDITIKVADTHIENLRFACEQAIASENVLIGLWSQMAQRGLEFAKYQLDAQLTVLNANIAIYNAKQGGRAANLQARKLQLEEKALELQAQKMQLDGELARGQINEQNVRVYVELCKAVTVEADLYKSEVQGALGEAEVEKAKVEMFKAQIQGVAAQIDADSKKFIGYESQIKGELAKASLVESQARGYSAYVAGKSAQVEAESKAHAADIAREDIRLRAFLGNLEKDKVLIQHQAAAVSAAAEAHRASTARITATAQAEASQAELEYKMWETTIRTNLARAEVELKKTIADMEQMIRVAGLQADILKAVGQGHATLAAGTMAGITIGASVDGRATIQGSGGGQYNTNLNLKGVEDIP